jgi:hypothetical protein
MTFMLCELQRLVDLELANSVCKSLSRGTATPDRDG